MSYMYVDFGLWLEIMYKYVFIIFLKNILIKDWDDM